MDIDYYNQVNREERQQIKEEQELKNKILSMVNSERKQAEWHKHFSTPMIMTDEYLTGNVF